MIRIHTNPAPSGGVVLARMKNDGGNTAKIGTAYSQLWICCFLLLGNMVRSFLVATSWAPPQVWNSTSCPSHSGTNTRSLTILNTHARIAKVSCSSVYEISE
eukprot:TRINITY_DN25678_c0_g1_i1.p1 TRINITY_DN25678_c0_g1~~TRINITY_DN25678_c0_g1_i1.p1  ORF type:complete len:102 (+),score=6.21 TRINITY_DN25678_c0_g1_i1:71-376(+)